MTSLIHAADVDALWLLYCLMIAGLGQFFQLCMHPNMIFRRYYLWLTLLWIRNRRKKDRWKRWLLKPLGLCVYCNTTWIAIFYYVYAFGINPEILLFIGLVFVWLKVLERIEHPYKTA